MKENEMRPLKLKFTAFGPYSDSQTIDFTSMKSNNMFVISGPTGSGKTTIFDAMSFALYGSASGSDRSADMLRSDFAKDGVETEVEFEFKIRQQIINIRRKPAQLRPKLRGEGMRKIESQVSLTIGNKVYTAQAEVSEKIEELIGLNKDQFKQIVLLPQGEFKKLLVSDSRSKEEIFRKIFNTGHIKRLQEEMRIDSANIKRAVDDIKLQITTILDDYPKIHNAKRLNGFKQNISNNLQQLNEHQLTITNELQVLQKKLDNETLFKNNKQQLVEVEVELKLLDNQQSQIAEYKKFLDNLQLIINYDHNLKTKAINNEQLTQLKYDLVTIKDNLQTIENSDLKSRYTVVKAKFDNLDKLRDEIHQFKQKVVEIENELNILEKIKELNLHVTTLQSEHKSNQEIVNDLSIKLDEATANKIKSDQLLEQIKLNEQQLESLTCKLTSYKQLQTITEESKQLVNTYSSLNQQVRTSQSHLSQLRNDYLSAQAGSLALELEDNKPCPVCGSLQHPSPANEAMIVVSPEQIQIAEENYTKLAANANDVMSKIEVNNALITNINDNNQFITDDYPKMIKELKAVISNQTKLATELQNKANSAQIENELTAVNEQIVIIKTNISNTNEQISELQLNLKLDATELNKIEQLNSQISTLSDEVARITNNYNQLNSELAAQLRTKDRLEVETANITANISSLETNLVEVNNQMGEVEAKFTTEQLTSYVQQLANQQQIQEQFNNYHTKLAVLNKQQLVLQQSINAYSPIDVDAITEKHNKLCNEHNIVGNLIREYAAIEYNLTNDLKRVTGLESKAAADLERYQIIADVSDIANGKSASKISFERYMLSIYFKQIIIRANQYFKTMSNNRFELEYKDSSGGRSAQGLDLNIIDNYTSKVRDVKSLSGGESFKAALSMALGLSDIVQMHSGGIQIDTIFIDEGFGSLDIDSLNTAIDTLINIESEGRMVGIISHVEELKNQITNKIEITPSPNGSNINVHFS